jgi:hypothetical protein
MANIEPKVTSIEFDLRKKGPKFDAWVTVSWGSDDEMCVFVGKKDPHKLSLKTLPAEAQEVLHRISEDLAKTTVRPLRGANT